MRVVLLLILIASFGCKGNDDETKQPGVTTGKDSVVRLPDTNNPYASVDVSPMDMVYYPIDFPKLKTAKQVQGDPLVRIIYSRPHKAGREIFGGLQKYNEHWRLGANESSEIQLFSATTIQNRKIPAGRYILYCIPDSSKWIIVLNSHTDSWGLQQDTQKDIARFEIPIEKTTQHFELFTMGFEKTSNGANLIMVWDNVLARLPFRW